MMDVAHPAPGAAVKEAIDVIRQLLSGEAVTLAGWHFTLQGVRLPWETRLPAPPDPFIVYQVAVLDDDVAKAIGVGPDRLHAIRGARAGEGVGVRRCAVTPAASRLFESLGRPPALAPPPSFRTTRRRTPGTCAACSAPPSRTRMSRRPTLPSFNLPVVEIFPTRWGAGYQVPLGQRTVLWHPHGVLAFRR